MIKLLCLYYPHSSFLQKCFNIFLVHSSAFRTLFFTDHFLLLPFAWLSDPALPLAFSPGVASRLPHFLHNQVENFFLEGGGKVKEGEGERSGLTGMLCVISAFFTWHQTNFLITFQGKILPPFLTLSNILFLTLMELFTPLWTKDLRAQFQQVLRVGTIFFRKLNFAWLCPFLCLRSYCITLDEHTSNG